MKHKKPERGKKKGVCFYINKKKLLVFLGFVAYNG